MVSQEDIDVAFAKHLERVAEDHYLDLRVERAFAKKHFRFMGVGKTLKARNKIKFKGKYSDIQLEILKRYGLLEQPQISVLANFGMLTRTRSKAEAIAYVKVKVEPEAKAEEKHYGGFE